MFTLTRSNIGNARIAGLEDDLGLEGNQYGNAVSLLYATYVPLELPCAILLKVIGPKYLLSFCTVAWGLICLCTGFVQNWQGLYTCRLLLGLFEAGLIPCINVYLGMVYNKEERGKRYDGEHSDSGVAKLTLPDHPSFSHLALFRRRLVEFWPSD